MHHKITGLHAIRIHRAAGGPPAPAHITTGHQVVLAKELPVGDQHQPPGGQQQPLQFGAALGFQGDRRVLLDQAINGWEIVGVGHKARHTVVLLQQRHRPGGLGRKQPHPGLFLLVTLHQGGEFAELVGVGGHRPAGQVKAVGVLVGFGQFRQVDPQEGLHQAQGRRHRAMQAGRQQRRTIGRQ